MNIATILSAPWDWSKRQLARLAVDHEQVKKTIVNADPTAGTYRPSRFFSTDVLIKDLPMYTVFAGKMMLDSDPLIQYALNVRNAALSVAEVEITARRPDVKAWLESQWHTIWEVNGSKVRKTKQWGYAGLQPTFRTNPRTGLIEIEDLKDFAPEDVRALESEGKVCGFRLKGQPLMGPFALWLSFNTEYGSPYGKGLLRRMYGPWYLKWMTHGVEDLIKLRMIKDAYIGDIFWYAENQMAELPDGTQVSFRDLYRQISEKRLSGGAMVLPKVVDDKGHELTGYTPPQTVGGASDVFIWADRTDEAIFRGSDIPLEVVKAQENGGFSGRSIPFMTLLGVCNQEFADYVQPIERYLKMMAWLNWGADQEFEIKPKSLVESFSQDTSGSAMGGGAMGGQPSQQRPVDSQFVPRPGMTQQGGQQPQQMRFSEEHSFSSTQFNLPGELAFEVIRLGDRIHADDLAGDGRELNPHVTIKYGLHTDDAEEVRRVVQGFGPLAITLGQCSVFAANEATVQRGGAQHDVIKIEVESDQLRALNAAIADNLRCTDIFPVYKPHITVAYVKPGLGEHYARQMNDLAGKAVVFDRVVFSDKSRNHTSIALTGTTRFDTQADEPQDLAGTLANASKRRIRLAAEQIADVVGAVQKKTADLTDPFLQPTLMQEITQLIRNLGARITSDLQASMVTANMIGAADVVVRMPSTFTAPPAIVTEAPPASPPGQPPLAFLFPDEPQPIARFPILEDAVSTLEQARIFTGTDYREVAEQVKQGAFGITAPLVDEQVAEIRDLLVENLRTAPDMKAFVGAVQQRLGEGGPLSERHIEQIFRNNMASQFTNGASRALENPMVADAFPYRSYFATTDQRTRHTHRKLEKLGLNGTNVYRADDPTWRKFMPPWEWQCRCSWAPATVEQAAKAGVQEAIDWYARMVAMATERGGRPTQYQTQTAPMSREWVTAPEFNPPPEYQRL